MKKSILLSLVCCGLLTAGLTACNEDTGKIAESLSAKASALVAQMADADAQAVDDCDGKIPECDVESADVCDALESQCVALAENLKEVRKPAVDCWQDVAACEDDSDANCDAAAEVCDVRDNDRHTTRQPIVDCAEISASCLAEALDAGEDAAICDEIIAQCEDASQMAIEAEHARFNGDDDAEDKCDRARDMVEEGKVMHGDIKGNFHEEEGVEAGAADTEDDADAEDHGKSDDNSAWSDHGGTAMEIDTDHSAPSDTAAGGVDAVEEESDAAADDAIEPETAIEDDSDA